MEPTNFRLSKKILTTILNPKDLRNMVVSVGTRSSTHSLACRYTDPFVNKTGIQAEPPLEQFVLDLAEKPHVQRK